MSDTHKRSSAFFTADVLDAVDYVLQQADGHGPMFLSAVIDELKQTHSRAQETAVAHSTQTECPHCNGKGCSSCFAGTVVETEVAPV
jgi:hypothetical protein